MNNSLQNVAVKIAEPHLTGEVSRGENLDLFLNPRSEALEDIQALKNSVRFWEGIQTPGMLIAGVLGAGFTWQLLR